MKKTRYFLSIIAFIFSILQCKISEAQYAGNALRFDGIDDIVLFGNIDYHLTNAFSITARVNWSVTPSSGNKFATLFANNSFLNLSDAQFWLQHNSNNSNFQFIVTLVGAGGVKTVTSLTSPIMGAWYYIAGVYNGSKMYIYVNGVAEDSLAVTGNIIPLDATMLQTMGGSAPNAFSLRLFTGIMDDITIWNRGLSKYDIQSMYICKPKGTESGLIGYWNLDETAGIIVHDLSSLKNNGLNIDATIVPSTAPIYCTLPVELLYINTACNLDSNIVISWATASETNNDYFTIQRSTNGNTWVDIGIVKGAGNSNSVEYYSFTDKDQMAHHSYYRIEQTDFDGSVTTYPPFVGLCKNNNTSAVLYPNPAGDYVNLSFSNIWNDGATVNIYIYDGSGKQVSFMQQITNADRNIITINVMNLKPGLYFMRAFLSDMPIYSDKFLINN